MRKMPPSREVQRERRAWAIESERWTHERHVEKGYRIKWGYVAIAYLVEFMVIGASLWGAWLFAAVYSDGDNHAFYFMLLAPLVYAAVELCRVPLGILARTQRSYFIRALAIVGIIFAAGVTTKSVSQLGEMMFHPRLMEASKTKTALKDAQADRGTIDNRIAAADARVAQYTTELDQIEKRSADNAAQLSALPAQRCEKVFGTNSRGVRYQNLKCVTDPRTATLSASVAKASADRGVLTKDLEEARKARAQLDRGAAERKFGRREALGLLGALALFAPGAARAQGKLDKAAFLDASGLVTGVAPKELTGLTDALLTVFQAQGDAIGQLAALARATPPADLARAIAGTPMEPVAKALAAAWYTATVGSGGFGEAAVI